MVRDERHWWLCILYIVRRKYSTLSRIADGSNEATRWSGRSPIEVLRESDHRGKALRDLLQRVPGRRAPARVPVCDLFYGGSISYVHVQS